MELHFGLYSEMLLQTCTWANKSDAHQAGLTNNTKAHFMNVVSSRLVLQY